MGHTPGPWEIRKLKPEDIPNFGLPLNGIYCKGQLIATAGNYNHAIADTTARLIVSDHEALPKLLDACKRISPTYRGDTVIIDRREWEKIEQIVREIEEG